MECGGTRPVIAGDVRRGQCLQGPPRALAMVRARAQSLARPWSAQALGLAPWRATGDTGRLLGRSHVAGDRRRRTRRRLRLDAHELGGTRIGARFGIKLSNRRRAQVPGHDLVSCSPCK